MASELRADLNNALKLIEQFVKRYLLEGALVIMVCIATISSIISWAKSDRSSEIAITSDIRSASVEQRLETELRRTDERWSIEYNELKKEYRLLQMKVDRYEAKLEAQGDN